MTRLVAICLSLPLVLGPAIGRGQQTQPGTAEKPATSATVKQPSDTATKQTTSHHAKRRSKTVAHKGAKRPQYRPEYGENSVEVINGDATKQVVFHHDEQTASATKNAPKVVKNAPPPPMKVEVMNGSSTNTQYFYGNGRNEQVAAVRNQQVVVGVQSSNTRTVGGNKHPVVTSVNSAETGDAKTASSGGQPVTNAVAPHPKRPAYQPDVH